MFVIIQLVFYGLVTFIVVKVALFIRYYMDLYQKLRKLPHRPTHWLYGNLHQIKTSSDYMSNVTNMVNNEGIRIYCVWIGPFPVVGVTHPELCKEVTQKESRKWVYGRIQTVITVYWNPILLVDFIFNWSKLGRKQKILVDNVHKFTGPLIKARREQLKLHPDLTTCKRRLDFLDILLTAKDENGQYLTPQEVQDEVDTFTLAGHDTTASAISWAIYSLAKYPVFASDHLRFYREDISQFEYLAQFLKEVLRLYSPVPLIARRHTETIVIDGFEIPPGPRIDINLTAINHNEAVCPDPKKFDPERFAKDHRNDTENYGFIPFSASTRNCIGQQFALNDLKITLAKLVNRFEVIRDDTFEDPNPIPDIILRPSNGIRVKLKQR